MSSRVVGNPQSGRLFGAKSVEALTASERRRSGNFVPPPSRTPSPPPEPVLPKVIYVPLPQPPRTSTEDYWAHRLSQVESEARRQCGLPPLSPGVPVAQPWPGTMPTLVNSEAGDTTSSDTTTSSGQSAPPLPRRPSLWKRVLMAFRCLRGR